jgi:hypothetical protein
MIFEIPNIQSDIDSINNDINSMMGIW